MTSQTDHTATGPAWASAPRRTSTYAIVALVMGILSFVCLPVIGPILAIVFAREARKELAADPTLDGEAFAKVGMVLGVVALVLTLVMLVAFFGMFAAW